MFISLSVSVKHTFYHQRVRACACVWWIGWQGGGRGGGRQIERLLLFIDCNVFSVVDVIYFHCNVKRFVHAHTTKDRRRSVSMIVITIIIIIITVIIVVFVFLIIIIITIIIIF